MTKSVQLREKEALRKFLINRRSELGPSIDFQSNILNNIKPLIEEIENEKYNAKAEEDANVIDNLIDFRLDQGLKSFNAIAQVTGVVINTAINIGAFAANVLGMKEANGFVSMFGKIQNSIDIARSVLSGKITNANVLPQEIKSFTDSMKAVSYTHLTLPTSDLV